MERMIYEQQMKKVDLSTAVVDNKRKEGSVSSTTTPGSAPFSGFLLTPPPPDPNQKLSIDGSVVDADPVLVSCVDKLAHWLVRAACCLVISMRALINRFCACQCCLQILHRSTSSLSVRLWTTVCHRQRSEMQVAMSCRSWSRWQTGLVE